MTDPRQNKLLEALPEDDYQRILNCMELVQMPFGKILYDSGEKLNFVYFPTNCFISLLCVMENGSTTEVSVVGNDGAIGIALFMGGETMPNQAMVLIPGYAYRIPAFLFMQEFNRHCALLHVLLRYTQAHITLTAQTAVCNRHHAVDQQLCRWLLLILDRLPSNELNMTQELIARMLGVRREGITEAAGRLQREGLIQYSRGHITVLDRLGLEARVCECYQVVKKESDRLLAA